ncbi:hypothetical protein ABKA04_009633 [Annulohypoxylon sp. FPYF3050]
MMDAQHKQQIPRDQVDFPDIHRHISAIKALQRQARDETVAFANKCLENYQNTGSEMWLHNRRFALERYIIACDHLDVTQIQRRGQVQADLNRRIPSPAVNGAHANAGHNLPESAISNEIANSNAPHRIHNQVANDNARKRARSIEGTPIKEETTSPAPQPVSVYDKISFSWSSRGTLRFDLKEMDHVNETNPAIYFGRWDRKKHEWIAEGLGLGHRGAYEKCHVVLATSENHSIICKAFNFLVNYKDKLARDLADAENVSLTRRVRRQWEEPLRDPGRVSSRKLELRIVPRGENRLVKDRGDILFRDIDLNGDLQTWCPITRSRVRPGDISHHDMIFWVSDQCLEDFYQLQRDILLEWS